MPNVLNEALQQPSKQTSLLGQLQNLAAILVSSPWKPTMEVHHACTVHTCTWTSVVSGVISLCGSCSSRSGVGRHR